MSERDGGFVQCNVVIDRLPSGNFNMLGMSVGTLSAGRRQHRQQIGRVYRETMLEKG